NDQPGAQFHGTAVWSLFAGRVPGRLRGVAPGAAYLLAKTEDVRSETRIEEVNYVRALEWADSIGVDIVSSSLGYLDFDDGFTYSPADLNGRVAVTSVAAESAAAHGILVVTAAGNGGPSFRTLVTPGDADSVITAGAVFPTAITPLTPAGAVLASITPSFSWSVSTPPPYATPISYRLRIARDATFLYLVVDTLTTATSFALRRALKPGRPLFWRVD